MKVQCIPSDIISNLPSSIIQTILTLMPIRDAFRTSVLSRKWRYHCANIPKLEFDDNIWQQRWLPEKHKLLLDIYTILLLHQCPVLEFSLYIPELKGGCEFDQMILHLSRTKALEKFTLRMGSGNRYTLPSSFFSMQSLTYLKLRTCTIHPSTTFSAFGRLTSLCFQNVYISKSALLQFLSCCPIIKNFTLIDDDKYPLGEVSSKFVDLFQRLPLVENLHMSYCPVKLFASGVIPMKFANLIVRLNVLRLEGLSFAEKDELRFVLLLISNSPNIKKIKLEMCSYNRKNVESQIDMDSFDPLDYSYTSLEHLRELKMIEFTGMKPEMDFVKLIMAKSPMLLKVRLEFDTMIDYWEKNVSLEGLLELPRASSRAKIVC